MIDGKILASGFISGANLLYNNRKAVDALNVFPVPDGDTGTNMSMTCTALAKALMEIESDSVTKICDTMSYATLRGARGNSGVILSQYFRGMAKALKGKNTCSPIEFAKGLKSGSDAAYAAVMNPTEGTILTVGRVAAEAAVKAAEDGTELLLVVEAALNEGKSMLLKTPDMLPALKNAGVVDAGGQGWIFLLEGVYMSLKGEDVERSESIVEQSAKTSESKSSIDTSDIKYAYCTEFIIEKSDKDVNVLSFKQSIESKGDSMLVIDDDEIVKVHIHTNNPGYVLERAIKLGAMINIKIDNMKYQHDNLIKSEEKVTVDTKEKKKFGFVAVCAGEGLEKILLDLGVDKIIKGGQTMNPSTEDILDAASSVNAETVFIFPNNKNIIMAATQAAGMCENRAMVIPSRSVPDCVAAMLKFNEAKNPEENDTLMQKAVGKIKTGQVTYAVRDTVSDDKQISKDDIIGITRQGIEAVGTDKTSVLLDLCSKMYDEDDNEFINVYYGEEVSKEEAMEISDKIEELYPDAEISVNYGGQPIYYYIISVE